MTELSLALAGGPPALGVPGLGAAPLGWLVSVGVLAGPTALNALAWQRRLRQWWRYFTLWRAKALWASLGGSLLAALGAFLLTALLPAWQDGWTTWLLRVEPTALTPGGLDWLRGLHAQEALALQAGGAALFLGGAALVLAAHSRLAQRLVLVPRGPDDWLNITGDPLAPAAPPEPLPVAADAPHAATSAPPAAWLTDEPIPIAAWPSATTDHAASSAPSWPGGSTPPNAASSGPAWPASSTPPTAASAPDDAEPFWITPAAPPTGSVPASDFAAPPTRSAAPSGFAAPEDQTGPLATPPSAPWSAEEREPPWTAADAPAPASWSSPPAPEPPVRPPPAASPTWDAPAAPVVSAPPVPAAPAPGPRPIPDAPPTEPRLAALDLTPHATWPDEEDEG